MSPIKREWLIHGCLSLPKDDRGRVSQKIKGILSKMYDGETFRIRSWPQRGFRDTLWWYETSVVTPGQAASYFLKVDNKRGPNLYVGISVEKAYESEDLAHSLASKTNPPVRVWLLDDNWDWHRFLPSLPEIKPLVLSTAKALQSTLYFWLEFGHYGGKRDDQYFSVSQDNLYWRGGFRPVKWDALYKFASESRPDAWGGIYLVKAFSLNDCTPYLDEAMLVEVFRVMRPIRDLWRGSSSHHLTS
jgi:hypothetical protein